MNLKERKIGRIANQVTSDIKDQAADHVEDHLDDDRPVNTHGDDYVVINVTAEDWDIYLNNSDAYTDIDDGYIRSAVRQSVYDEMVYQTPLDYVAVSGYPVVVENVDVDRLLESAD